MIESRLIGTVDSAKPTLVFLHEGLGSVSAWRNFPDQLCDAVGTAGILYSRTGYGQSPEFSGPLNADFMHRAAGDELRGLLNQHGVNNPVLIGHSDGASIALIYAGLYRDDDRHAEAVVVMAPHLFVEPICTTAIGHLRSGFSNNKPLQQSLARHHRSAELTLTTWSDVWLSEEFRQWDIRDITSTITAPILAIQGEDDQYGTMLQIDELERCAPQTQSVRLANCGHSPHRDQTATVISSIADFLHHGRI